MKRITRRELGKGPFYPRSLVETEKGFGDKDGMVSFATVKSHLVRHGVCIQLKNVVKMRLFALLGDEQDLL
jgi:hypothetical protein